MRSLFETEVFTETVNRINRLTSTQPALWGKMNVSQMLAHCKEAFRVPLSEKKLPRIFLGYLLGPLLKSKLYDDSPWKQNLPTAPAFVIKDQRDFHMEKEALLELVNKFYASGPAGITKFPHPFFGSFTPDQWGKSMYKHLDHHLRQFGV